jgi:hypothetical protein
VTLFRRILVSAIGASAALWTALPYAAPVRFIDVTAGSGIRFQAASSSTSQKYLPESMLGGVAMLDYDGDGRMDLYFVNGAAISDPMPPGKRPDKSDPRYWNRLWHNNGDGTFSDVTEKAGIAGDLYGMGAAAGDYDNDGRTDLYVTNLGRNILYRNNGDGTFTDVTERAGVAGAGWSASAAFLDYDRDGKLDLVVARYLEWSFEHNPYCGERRENYRAYCHPDQFKPISHLLYRNNGDGTFSDVSEKAGLSHSPGKGLGVAVNDFDRDGWPDILIANDSFQQQLFRNRHDGTFEEIALLTGLGYDDDGRTFAGMGVDAGDYDRDGWPDIFINALANQKYALFHNNKDSFEYVSGPSGVAVISQMHSGWGAKFIDYDNDGWLDLFVAQGHVMDNIQLTQPALRYREPLLLMRNVHGKFMDVSAQSGDVFQKPIAARGAAFGDLDNDGSIDVVVCVKDGPALILHNQGAAGAHWLTVRLVGRVANRDGIGAAVRVIAEDDTEQRSFVTASGSYMSSNDVRSHFGLGTAKSAKRIEITWPSGTLQKLEQVRADQILTVEEPAGAGEGQTLPPAPPFKN